MSLSTFILSYGNFLGLRNHDVYRDFFYSTTGCMPLLSGAEAYECKYLHDLFSYTKSQALHAYIVQPLFCAGGRRSQFLELFKAFIGVLTSSGYRTIGAMFEDEDIVRLIKYTFYVSTSKYRRSMVLQYLQNTTLEFPDLPSSEEKNTDKFEFVFYNKTTQKYRQADTTATYKDLLWLASYYPAAVFKCYSDIEDNIRTLVIIPVESFSECGAFNITLSSKEFDYNGLGAFSSLYVMSSYIVTTQQYILLHIQGSSPSMAKVMSNTFSFITLSQTEGGQKRPAVYSNSKICIFEYMPKVFDDQFVILDVNNKRVVYSVPSDDLGWKAGFPPNISMSRLAGDGRDVSIVFNIIPVLGFQNFAYVDADILGSVANYLSAQNNWISQIVKGGLPIASYMGLFYHYDTNKSPIVHLKGASTDSLPDPFSIYKVLKGTINKLSLGIGNLEIKKTWDENLIKNLEMPIFSNLNFHIYGSDLTAVDGKINLANVHNTQFMEDIAIAKKIINKKPKSELEKKLFKDNKKDLTDLFDYSTGSNILTFITSILAISAKYKYFYGTNEVSLSGESLTEAYAHRMMGDEYGCLAHSRLSRAFVYSAELNKPTVGFKHKGQLLTAGLADFDFEINNSFYGQCVALPVSLGMNIGVGYTSQVAPYIFGRLASSALGTYNGFTLKGLAVLGYLDMSSPNIMAIQDHPSFFVNAISLHPAFSRKGHSDFMKEVMQQPYKKVSNLVATGMLYFDKEMDVHLFTTYIKTLTTIGCVVNNSYGIGPLANLTIYKHIGPVCIGLQMIYHLGTAMASSEPLSFFGVGFRPFVTASTTL